MKPFVKWLKIETLVVQDQTVNEEINGNLLDHILEGRQSLYCTSETEFHGEKLE